MRANVIGRVRNTHLPVTQGLLPLFEAIINSIDSIEDSERELENGSIDVVILRHSTLDLPEDNDGEQSIDSPIYGFEIHDNGIGFTERNFSAFNTADTQYKAKRGGKGVGRFVWLKAFEKIEIESMFIKDGVLMKRNFIFSLSSRDGISEHSLEPAPESEVEHTIVRLLGYKPEYALRIPRNAYKIAQRIFEHCLEYFVLGIMPYIRISFRWGHGE